MNKKKSAKDIRLDKLYDLINACRERYKDEEIVAIFNEATGKEYIEKPEEITEGDMVWDLTAKGYCIFKPNSLRESERLRELAEKYVFTYVNEQAGAILF